jgi:hypothetical protein
MSEQALELQRIKKLNDDLAQGTWKTYRDTVTASLGYSIQFGVAALAAPVTVNGAAIAGVLGFVSANTSRLAGESDAISNCFNLFACGFVVSALASALAYASQFGYTHAQGAYITLLEHPYVKLRASKWSTFSVVAHTLCIIAVVAGYVFLICGLQSFKPLLVRTIGQNNLIVRNVARPESQAQFDGPNLMYWTCTVATKKLMSFPCPGF